MSIPPSQQEAPQQQQQGFPRLNTLTDFPAPPEQVSSTPNIQSIGVGTRECRRQVSLSTSSYGYRALHYHLERLGCGGLLQGGIECEMCHTPPKRMESECGFYSSFAHKITVCANQFEIPTQIQRNVLHETLHLFDKCRLRAQKETCATRACSEIRAARLFYCMDSAEPERCTESVASNHLAKFCGDQAPVFVRSAWNNCYHDTAPFHKEELPNIFNYISKEQEQLSAFQTQQVLEKLKKEGK